MPTFANDELDPARAAATSLLQICADHRDTVVHTMRELLRAVRGALVVRWTLDGFQSAKRGPTAEEQRAQPVRVPRRDRQPRRRPTRPR